MVYYFTPRTAIILCVLASARCRQSRIFWPSTETDLHPRWQ